MFERIGRYAEAVATSAGQSRRGFLGLLGKGALSLAGLVAGILLVPGEAAAVTCTGGCRFLCPDGSKISGQCGGKTCACDATRTFRGMTCNLEASNCLHEW
jgi:hypothetical protein